MSERPEIHEAARRVRAAVDAAAEGLVEREVLVELAALGAVAREHLLVIGPPGTAKSQAIRRIAACLGGDLFEYLLGRFTEPAEIFGPVDLRKLQDGVVETATAGMLPEAEIAFLDEIFQGSTAILNTLLGVLNERRFRRGHTVLDCPLRLAVGASNALPDDPSLAAFADRFLLQLFVEPITDSRLEDLLESGWRVDRQGSLDVVATTGDLDCLAAAALLVDLDSVRPRLARALRLLRGAGIELSDRRAVKCQRLIAAAAVLDGRSTADGRDLWPIVYAVPSSDAQQMAREVLRQLLAECASDALTAAAEDASHGPAARARRLLKSGLALLDGTIDEDDQIENDQGEKDQGEDGPSDESRRLQIEGHLREIDAGFDSETGPADLLDLRARLAAAIEPSDAAAS